MLVCVSLLVGVSTALEHNDSEELGPGEHVFEFETVNESESFEYTVNDSTVDMNGTVEMPTPCYELQPDLAQNNSSYTLMIDSVHESNNESSSGDGNESESEACPQVVDYQGFEAVFSGHAPYDLSVIINGNEVGNISVDESGSETGMDSVVNETEETDSNETVNETVDDAESSVNESDELMNDSINESDTALNESEELNESEQPETGNETGDSDVTVEPLPENESADDDFSTPDQQEDSGIQGIISSIRNFLGLN